MRFGFKCVPVDSIDDLVHSLDEGEDSAISSCVMIIMFLVRSVSDSVIVCDPADHEE